MEQHTPGPWVWGYYGMNDEWVRTGDGEAVVPVGYNQSEREANARLIAAAPELLAALKRAIEVLDAEGITYGNCDDEPLDVLNAARAAIAKAEGK
jgi:hypothetical protein